MIPRSQGAELLLAIAEQFALGALPGCYGNDALENLLAAVFHRLDTIGDSAGVDIHIRTRL